MPDVGDFILASDVAVPPGIVAPFYNVTLSGRYPIFWGKTEADTGWLVCDGGSDLHGGTVPNLINKFIMGTNTVSEAKKTGGSTTTSSTSTSGTIGATTLTNATVGSHQHYNGVVWDTGWLFAYGSTTYGVPGRATDATNNNWGSARLYQGLTSATTVSNTSGSHTHSFTGSSHTHTVTPPYYKLIYLVKLP